MEEPPLDAIEQLSFKVIALGASGVGKTSIVQRYSSGIFQPNSTQTIGAAYVKCVVPLSTGEITLNVWDTAGQEKFQSLIPLYLHGADACVIVFDLTSPSPIGSLDKLYAYVKDNLDPNVYVVLCGNKIDLITTEPEGVTEWSLAREISYFTTSAKTGQGIDALFFAVADGVRNTKESVPITLPSSRQSKEPETGCC
jgi:small GTP-binding protein